MVQIELNGAAHSLPDDADVAAAVARLTESRRGIAVALNGSVVPRAQWDATRLHAGDRVEVLSASQGG